MPSGYVRIWAPDHPLSNADGYVLEHRKVLHDAGVELAPGQHVHHLNGDKQDNRLENLQPKEATDHAREHAVERGFVENQFGVHDLRGERECERCGKTFLPWTKAGRFCSRACANKRRVGRDELGGGFGRLAADPSPATSPHGGAAAPSETPSSVGW